MTERLTALMYDEADHLDVPAPSASVVLTRGRSLRRRRQALQAGTGLASIALVAGVAVAATSGGDGSRDALDPSGSPTAGPTSPSTDLGAVFAMGPEVHLVGPGITAVVDDVTVKSMYYTSAGVLVRHGKNNFSDGGGPQRYSLVTPTGEVRPIDVVTNEVVPGVDAEQALLAYAEVVDGIVEVVVHDLVSDAEVARVSVPEATEWGGWSAPPVSLSGDDVYVGTDDIARVVDWRTGQVTRIDTVPPGFPPQVNAGLTTEVLRGELRVYAPLTGKDVATFPDNSEAYDLTLSPDGRFARIDAFSGPLQVYVVDSGEPVDFSLGDRTPTAMVWAPDGTLIALDEAGVLTTCAADTGECAAEQLELDVLPYSSSDPDDYSDDLVLGNQIRES